MKTMISTVSIIALALFSITACGDDGGGDGGGGGAPSLKDQPLQGKINGESWDFSVGDANPSSSDDASWSVTLRAGTEKTCQGFGDPDDADDRKIIASFPKEPGEYELGLQTGHTVTFTYGGNQNIIGTSGKLVIGEVTNTTVKGSLVARGDADNMANGNFELIRCDTTGDQ